MAIIDRYPELDFLLQLFPESSEEEFREIPLNGFLPPVDVIYIYGFPKNFELFVTWVKEEKHRDVVIIEDQIAVLRKMVEEGVDRDFVNDQVHFRFKLQEKDWEEFVSSLTVEFPYSRILVLEARKSSVFEELKLLLMRKSVLEEAVIAEMLNYHILYQNLSKNFSRLEEAFDVGKLKDAFKGMPAILCGAGPSLAGIKEALKRSENKALILAGGSGITALGAMNIDAHFIYALDPNFEEFTRLAWQTQVRAPLISAPRVHPHIFYAHAGPLGYFPTGTGGGLEAFLEKELSITDHKILEGLSEEALSVITIALMTAIYFGCNPICLAGIDLAYTGGQRYAPGIISDLHCSLESQELKTSETKIVVDGHLSATKWIMERDVIADVIQKHPEITFIRTSKEGLPIPGAPYDPFWEEKLGPPKGINDLIHKHCIQSRFAFPKGIVEEKLEIVYKSFQRCNEIVKSILKELQSIYPNLEGKEETPRMIVFEMDLEEEIAFQIALKPAVYAFTTYLKREYRKDSNNPSRHIYLIKCQLYRKLEEIIDDYLH